MKSIKFLLPVAALVFSGMASAASTDAKSVIVGGQGAAVIALQGFWLARRQCRVCRRGPA